MYVDDSFVIIKKDAVFSFYDTLNTIDPKISSPSKWETMVKLPFWIPWFSKKKNGVAVIDVYRKPTHTDRYLDFSSHHQKKHKISTVTTLLCRASNLPSTNEGKARELRLPISSYFPHFKREATLTDSSSTRRIGIHVFQMGRNIGRKPGFRMPSLHQCNRLVYRIALSDYSWNYIPVGETGRCF